MAWDPTEGGFVHLKGLLFPWDVQPREIIVDAWRVHSFEPASVVDAAACTAEQLEWLERSGGFASDDERGNIPHRDGAKVSFRNGDRDESLYLAEDPLAVAERVGKARLAGGRRAAPAAPS